VVISDLKDNKNKNKEWKKIHSWDEIEIQGRKYSLSGMVPKELG